MKALLFLTITTLLYLSSCSDNPSEPTQSTDLWPMKIGNFWVYEVYEYDSNGFRNPYPFIDTVKVVADTTYVSTSAHILVSSRMMVHEIHPAIYVKNDSGIYAYDYSSGKLLLFFKQPIINDDYYYDETIVTVGNAQNTYTKIDLHQGTLIYRMYNQDSTSVCLRQFYLSYGIGLNLFKEQKYRGNKLISETYQELVEYHLE